MIRLTLLAALAAFSPPGPIDACKLNYREAKVSAKFQYRKYVVDDLPSDNPIQGPRQGWEPASEPSLTILGKWESDGETERLMIKPDDIKHGPGHRIYAFPFESLYDGKTLAYHAFEGRKFLMEVIETRKPPFNLYGPFAWWQEPFPLFVDTEFSNAAVSRRRSLRAGRPIETEVYKQPAGGGYMQLIINYDPASGFLPVYIRGFSYVNGRELSSFKECFILDSKPCAAGGFVPTEWVDTSFIVKDFDPSSPRYNDDAPLRPTGKVVIGHFKILELADQKAPVSMNELEGVQIISSSVNSVKLRPSTRTLTLPQILRSLGGKVGNTTKAANERRPPQMSLQGKARIYTFSLCVMAFLGGLWALRRMRSMIFVAGLILLVASGCTQSKTSVPRLTAEFTQPELLYEHGLPSIPLTLNVINRWSHPLKLAGVDGGCSCRQVDPSVFPFSLSPGENRLVNLTYQPKDILGAQNISFAFVTDMGNIVCRAIVKAFPKHHISPESVTLSGIFEDEGEQEFELVHRETTKIGTAFESTRLVAPRECELMTSSGETRDGLVEGAEGFAFRETTYRVSLKDRRLGSHRVVVSLRGGVGDDSLIDVPVAWRRVPYLSSAPERVILGKRAIRVFLRCPDDSVELTRVISFPRGVKAVVSSPRELIVQSTEETPDVLEGAIMVGTTSANHASLEIPLVRYSPDASLH